MACLKILRKILNKITLTSNCELVAQGQDKLEGLVFEIHTRENMGRDFSVWQSLIMWLKLSNIA